MLAFRAHMQESTERVTELEEQLRQFQGSQLAQKLDSAKIVPSQWANRHDSSFEGAKFQALRSDIESAGGNVQPILVRPKSGGEQYEIVFGHRRHRACLELGLPVLAVVAEVNDRDLFAAMDRENRARADLSPFEQGEMYRRALDDGLFPSLRDLSRQLGVDPGNVSKAIGVARLPAEIIGAFPLPTQIQFRWGSDLHKALQRDPDLVLARARELKQNGQPNSASEVMDFLLHGQPKKAYPEKKKIFSNGSPVGNYSRAKDGGVRLEFEPNALSEQQAKRLVKSLGFTLA